MPRMPKTEAFSHGSGDKGGWPRRLLFAAAGLLFAVPAVYVIVQVVLAMRSTYRTETAIAYTLADSITLNGIVAFEATPVAGSGNLGYLVADGERVTDGTVLAECYTSPEQGVLRQRLDRLQGTISLLERSQSASGTEIAQLTAQTQQALYALVDVLDSGSFAGASAAGDDFVLPQNRLQLRTGESDGFAGQLAALQSEEEELQAQLAALPTIQADTHGYFVSAASAADLAVDRATLEEMTPAELQALLASGVPQSGESGAGRIVSGFNWRFYTVCTEEQAERLEELKTVRFSVPGKQETPLTASIIQRTRDDATGLTKLVLECEVINADVLRLGQEDARIDLYTYEGIRIDRAAMHIVDGQQGVYVKYGGMTRFRRITVLYENEKTILVPADGALGTDNEVRLYDEIIVEGNNLQDKKLL